MEGDPMNIEPITFEWNENHSRSDNFDTWLRRTNREHRNYKEKEYSIEAGLKIFNKLYPVGKLKCKNCKKAFDEKDFGFIQSKANIKKYGPQHLCMSCYYTYENKLRAN